MDSIVDPDGEIKREALTSLVQTGLIYQGLLHVVLEADPSLIEVLVENRAEVGVDLYQLIDSAELVLNEWSDYLEIR